MTVAGAEALAWRHGLWAKRRPRACMAQSEGLRERPVDWAPVGRAEWQPLERGAVHEGEDSRHEPLALARSSGAPAARPAPVGALRAASTGARVGLRIACDAGSRTLRLPVELEQLMSTLDQRVGHVSQAEEARLRMLADAKQRLFESLQAMRVAREIHEDRRNQDVKMLESNIMLEISAASKARAEMEARAEELCSRSLAEHQAAVRRHRDEHAAVQKDYARELGEEVKRIAAILEEQRHSRAESGDRISVSLEAEFQKIQEALAAEERLRYEAEGTMLKMVEDVCTRMRGEVRQERDEREAVQEKLLTLLEDTCNRIETGFCGAAAALPLHQARAAAAAASRPFGGGNHAAWRLAIERPAFGRHAASGYPGEEFVAA